MRILWDNHTKLKAQELRKEGHSFGELTQLFGVPKSTLHGWVRGIKRPERFTSISKADWAKQIQPLAVQAMQRKRLARKQRVHAEVKQEIIQTECDTYTKNALLAALYWAEGAKKGVLRFTNTDPNLMLLFTILLRSYYAIDECKLRIQLHLHEYHDERKMKKFWGNLLHIPEQHFLKTQRKIRSKSREFRRNVGGICTLRYNSVYLKDRVLLHAHLLGEKIAGRIDAPVA